jgi:hypothetical protein
MENKMITLQTNMLPVYRESERQRKLAFSSEINYFLVFIEALKLA